jgi:hypothetical protein
MVTSAEAAADELLSVFFGPANNVQPGPQLEPWIQRLRDGAPTILPADTAVGSLRLYAISPSNAAARGFAEELVAAIGPSWSDFDGERSELDSTDEIEAALSAHERRVGGGATYRITVRDRNEAWSAMERLRAAWRHRPPPRDEVLMPLPDLLRDVELALQTSAVSEAEWLIDVLRQRGELSSQNLLFLELRLLASSGRWGEVLQHPRLDDVLNAHRPVGVTSMLFEALDVGFLAAPAATCDADEALRVYQGRIARRFAPLIERGPDIATAAALQVRVLAAVDEGATRGAVLTLFERADAAARPWLETIARLVPELPATVPESPPSAVPADPVPLAREALYVGDHRRVLDLLAEAALGPQVIELLVGAAVGVGSLASARTVAERFNELEPNDQVALRNLPLLAAPLEHLLALGGDGAAVESWGQWLARLNAEAPFEAALEVAKLGAAEWTAAEPATHAEANALAGALTRVPEHAKATLERALPSLLAYLDRRTQPDEVALPVHQAILEVLAYGDSRSRTVREAALVVLGRLLEGTPSAEEYQEQLGLIEYIWDGVRAASTLGWLVDVLVAVVHHPCRLPDARDALIRRALADAVTLRDVDSFVLDLLVVLVTDSVLEKAFSAEATAIARAEPSLEGTSESAVTLDPGSRIIGIYSLSEPAARRAKAVLARRFPSLEIQLNHEHDDSDRLRSLARRADVMAVVIASAKHAATEAIRRHCAADALLEVGTAGSTGLIRAVVGRLQELAAP